MSKAKVKCNHDCFNCTFEDCIDDVLTKTERMESSQRDRNFTDYGIVILKGRPRRAKYRGSRS